MCSPGYSASTSKQTPIAASAPRPMGDFFHLPLPLLVDGVDEALDWKKRIFTLEILVKQKVSHNAFTSEVKCEPQCIY
jgi:hypothetical protein